jgi:Putative beta-lactamase-inhibitor-like, PepSY-like
MKNIFILLVVFSISLVPAFSQKNAPDNVKNEFAKKYPSAQSVKWASEEANEWEAEFKINGTEMSASFDNKGVWLETETEISVKELPASVTNTIAKDFVGFKTGAVSTNETPKMKGYEVELTNGETSLEVIFDNSGKVIKNTEIKKEKEDKK